VRILITRHGESIANKEGRLEGHSEHHLSDEGKIQSILIGKGIKDDYHPIDIIYSSDQTRSKETAEIIAEILENTETIYDKRLREFDCGILTGVKYIEELKIHYDRISEDYDYRIPEAETFNELLGRVNEYFQEIVESNDEKSTILIVAHAWPFYLIFKSILNIHPESNPWFEFCKINILERKSKIEKWKLIICNGEDYSI